MGSETRKILPTPRPSRYHHSGLTNGGMPQNIQHHHGTRSFPCSITPFHRLWATHGKQPATIQEMARSSRATAKLTATHTLDSLETRTQLEAQNSDPATEHRQWLSSWGQAGHAERQRGRSQVLRRKRPGKQEKKIDLPENTGTGMGLQPVTERHGMGAIHTLWACHKHR